MVPPIICWCGDPSSLLTLWPRPGPAKANISLLSSPCRAQPRRSSRAALWLAAQWPVCWEWPRGTQGLSGGAWGAPRSSRCPLLPSAWFGGAQSPGPSSAGLSGDPRLPLGFLSLSVLVWRMGCLEHTVDLAADWMGGQALGGKLQPPEPCCCFLPRVCSVRLGLARLSARPRQGPGTWGSAAVGALASSAGMLGSRRLGGVGRDSTTCPGAHVWGGVTLEQVPDCIIVI